MADQQGQSPPNWFERHPKKTIFGLVVILMLAATYGVFLYKGLGGLN